jgi:hypothetical protein
MTTFVMDGPAWRICVPAKFACWGEHQKSDRSYPRKAPLNDIDIACTEMIPFCSRLEPLICDFSASSC